MTARQAELMRWYLERPMWKPPMHMGARNGSWHHNVLQQLIAKGLVERRRRRTLMNVHIIGLDVPRIRRRKGSSPLRGSFEYRLTRAGVLARKALYQHEADVAEGTP